MSAPEVSPPGPQVSAEGSHVPEVREVLTWADFGDAGRELARVVAADFEPDVVVAVARGGLLPAGAVSYALGVKAIGTLNVEFYTDIAETLPDPVVLPPVLDGGALNGLKALVVDDVADSGRTLALVLDLVRSYGAEARSAVLYAKPTSVVEPDFVWKRTDRWITFPWSALPPVTAD
ncbi:phosphoribosyltransferase [Spongisporangium articulatum]|uniref:Phosphoribosyltransferase n=1 Tax=Spongisporangium articulatum TaxID=3362603 RepID=A0ABW8AS31_9ACTN